MPPAARPRFVDQLPAVLRQDERDGESFLGRFLRAFEVVFAEIEGEIEAIPELFAVAAGGALAAGAAPGERVLHLETAAGLCPGDVVLLEPPRDGPAETPELVAVAGGDAPPHPERVELAAAVRFAHARGTRVRPLLPAEPGGAVLALAAPSGARELRVADGAPGIAPGVALRVDAGARAEHLRVVRVEGGAVEVEPPLAHAHEPGSPVAVHRFAAQATPPPAFAHAPREGPELVLDAPVRGSGPAGEGDPFLELDTLSGIEPGDVLRIRDFDPARVEFVRVRTLPQPHPGPALVRRGVELERGVRHAHAAGTGVDVPVLPSGATLLAAAAPAGAARVQVLDPDGLGARPGDPVVVGAGWRAGRPEGGQWAEVREAAGRTLVLEPPLAAPAPAGAAVARVLPAGGALAALEWLAGWIGLALRPGRGERWNRDLLRRAGALWPSRGTLRGVQALLEAYLRGEAAPTLFDPSNPLQVGLVSTVGVDTIICGGPLHTFWVDLHTARRSMRLRTPEGMAEMVQAAHEALLREKPGHTGYTLRVHAPTLQIGTDARLHVGARVGDTTLLWSRPLSVAGDR